MKSYKYVKKVPLTITVPVVPFVSIILGFSILIWVIWPILSFQLTYAKTSGIMITPIVENVSKPEGSQTTTDYSKASNWFPKTTTKKVVAKADAYTISIPKLGITKAMVKIGTDDLSRSIVHYGGTELPGKLGNAVIFGHSVLPHFFDPNNYLTIFSTLPELNTGDDIYVSYDGMNYRYSVAGKKVTDPDDISGLEQRFDNSYMTLVTCVPPGTYLKRLWLVAKLMPFGKGKV